MKRLMLKYDWLAINLRQWEGLYLLYCLLSRNACLFCLNESSQHLLNTFSYPFGSMVDPISCNQHLIQKNKTWKDEDFYYLYRKVSFQKMKRKTTASVNIRPTFVDFYVFYCYLYFLIFFIVCNTSIQESYTSIRNNTGKCNLSMRG